MRPDTAAGLAALYQEMILDHYRRPRNRGTIAEPDATVVVKNPLCGDEIELQITMDDGAAGSVLTEVKFAGRGCSISQASASMMTELVKGKHVAEVDLLRQRFRAMVMGDAAAAADPALDRTRSLAGVARYPARVKCALLGWNALEQGISEALDRM